MAFEQFKRVVANTLQMTYDGSIIFGDGKVQSTAYRGLAGQFSSLADQTTASGTALNPVTLATTDYSDGVSVVSNSRITYANAGIYALEFDAQVESTDVSSRQDVYFFLRKNGVDVAGSTTSASVVINNGTMNGKTLVSTTHIVTAAAGDYFELVWAASSTAVSLKFTAASGTGIIRPSTAAISVATWLLK
jgi:hypothetical protein